MKNMIYSAKFISFLLVVARVSFADPNAKPCVPRKQAIPLLRAFRGGDHFYTTNADEMQRAASQGYGPEVSPGLVFPKPHDGLVPLYRLYSDSATDHFYTTDRHERDEFIKHSGYETQGIAGYVYPKKRCGATALFREYSEGATDHFYMTDAGERDRALGIGYSEQGNAGFILPSF